MFSIYITDKKTFVGGNTKLPSPSIWETGGNPNPSPFRGLIVILLFGILICGVIVYFSAKDDPTSPVVIGDDGEVSLIPERLAKLAKELEELDNAEQYVLRAAVPKEYPCYSCPNGQNTIYLHRGEVWKYGITRKGESKRYPRQDYGANGLVYFVQFEGPIGECLKQEKIKIYNYPLLPEALAREIKLFRPPGNKNDN